MSLLHSSWLFVIYFPELYISDLTVIISSIFCTGAVKTVKSCFYFSVCFKHICIFKWSVFWKKRASFFSCTFRNFQYLGFLLEVRFVKNTLKFLEVIGAFVAEIWSFMVFGGGFSIFDFDFWFMKPQTSFFQEYFFVCPSILQISCLLAEYY